MEGSKLSTMLFLGFILLIVGITGKIGSLLGAFIDPANMQEGNNSTSTTSGGTIPFPNYNPALANTAAMYLIITHVFTPAYADQAVKIATCESTLNPNAVNPTSVGGSNATGLFQILYPSTWNSTSLAGQNPKDPTINAKAAYEIFKRDGYSWREWDCAKKVGLS